MTIESLHACTLFCRSHLSQALNTYSSRTQEKLCSLVSTSLWRLCVWARESWVCLVKRGEGQPVHWAQGKQLSFRLSQNSTLAKAGRPAVSPFSSKELWYPPCFNKWILHKARVKESLETCINWLLQRAHSCLINQGLMREKTTCGTIFQSDCPFISTTTGFFGGRADLIHV